MPCYLVDEHNAGDELLLELGKVVWCWTFCEQCNRDNGPCDGSQCAMTRAPQLRRYLQYYKTVVSDYIDDTSRIERLIDSREGLFEVLAILRADPTATLSQLGERAFPNSTPQAQHHAMRLGVKVFCMVDSSVLHQSSDRLERGFFRIAWKSEVALTDYLEDIFPMRPHRILSQAHSEQFREIKDQLKAVNLKKDLGIIISATSDIQDHLRLDQKNNVLHIFHYTAFLKEQLRVTKEEKDCTSPDSVAEMTLLPRRLILEVLESLQGFLFPIADKRSKQLLHSLISTCGFDPDILRFEASSVRRDGEENVGFVYLADRLSELYNELQNPRPRGRLEQILERKSGARYVMMATLIGVIFAVMLGMASLGVSSYQTYIAYQAWQHPVSPPGDSG